MIALLVNLPVLALVLGLIYWMLTLLPVPQPFKNVVIVIFILISIIMLLGIVGWIPGWRIGYHHF